MLNRRKFISLGASACAGGLAGAGWARGAGATPADGASLPKPTPAQQAWQDCEIGIIYHFDLPIAAGNYAPNNSAKQQFDPNLYQPRELDTDQWIEAAKAAGAKYAIFTATHFNGFMQWPSDLYPYGLKQTSWREGQADVVANFVRSCHRAEIKPGLYFSTHRNAYWTVWGHYVDWGKGKDTAKQAEFNRIAEKMTEELCSRYGPLIQIWYDAGVKMPAEGGPDVLPIFERHQRNSVFYHNRQRADVRWIGNEQGYAAYPCWATMPGTKDQQSHNAPAWKPLLAKGDPEGTAWSPGMVDVPLRGANKVHNWFWAPNQDHAAYPTNDLVRMYYQSVGRNCNFVIGEVVAPNGLVPASDIQRLAEFGREIQRRFGSPIAEAKGEGNQVELALPATQKINHVAIMEEIAQGERIREYQVEGLDVHGKWVKLCEGQSVGHKRIQNFPPVEASRLRLRVLKSTANPMVRQLAVYNVETT